jgi:hypothetical protein
MASQNRKGKQAKGSSLANHLSTAPAADFPMLIPSGANSERSAVDPLACGNEPEGRRADAIAQLREMLRAQAGVKSGIIAERLISQIRSLQIFRGDSSNALDAFIAAVEMIIELGPKNATEAMLAVQMIGVHEAADRFLKQATVGTQTSEGVEANVNRASRLMRLFLDQVEAMVRLKGQIRQQRVTVEHVHVNSGGHAIVGAVAAIPNKPGENSK